MKTSALILALVISTVACNKADEYYSKPKANFSESIGNDEGLKYQSTTESFLQTSSDEQVDILWVVDNSGSMADQQENLASNFAAFAQKMSDASVNFKMAITTTDGRDGKSGIAVPDSIEKLNSINASADPARFISDFRTLIKVGTNGSGKEMGLQTAKDFVANYPTFFRPNAKLAIIEVSDEEEQGALSVKEYVDAIASVKAKPSMLKIYSICDLNNKSSGQGFLAGCLRYKEASDLTGSVVADIQQDFLSSLEELGDSIVNLINSFVLSGDVRPGTSIEVYVNNRLVAEEVDYTFDVASRTIKFKEDRLPPVGAAIKVVYEKEIL